MSTPSSDIPESDLWDLDAAFNAMQDEIATNDLVYHATEKALGEIARRFYPGLANWEPEQLNRLAARMPFQPHPCRPFQWELRRRRQS
jgi:hypothetical protein